MNIILPFIISAAVAHGVIAGYYHYHNAKMPEELDVIWRIAAMGALYCFASGSIALMVAAFKR